MTTGVVTHFDGGEYQDKSGLFFILIFGTPLVILNVFCHAVWRRESIACPRM